MGLSIALAALVFASLACALDEEMRRYDRVLLMNGQTIEGDIIKEDQTKVVLKRPDTIQIDIPRSEIRQIERKQTPKDVYAREKPKIQDAAGHIDLARFCSKHGLLIEAEAEVREAIKLDATRTEAYPILAAIFDRHYAQVAADLHESLRDRELFLYQHALKNGVRDTLVLHRAALILVKSGLDQTGLELLQEAAGNAGEAEADIALLRDLGDAQLGRGLCADAQRTFEGILARLPGDSAALSGAGRAAYGAGDLEEALRHFEAAARGADPQRVIEAKLAQGVIHYTAGRPGEARLALKGVPKDHPLAGQAQYYRGLTFLREGRFLSAVFAFDKALTSDDSLASPYLGLAVIEWLKGRLDRAKEQADHAVLGGPFARFFRALLLHALGEEEKAADELRLVAREGFHLEEVLQAASDIAQAQGTPRDALRLLEYAAEVTPPAPGLFSEIGRMHLVLKDARSAVRAFDRAIEMDPDHVPALCGRATVLYEQGSYDEARALFQRVVALDPTNAWARDGIRKLRESETRLAWRDRFLRPDDVKVRNYWIEYERYGVEIDLKNGVALFHGRQENQAQGETRLYREVERPDIEEFRVTLDPRGQRKATVGVRIEKDDAVAGVYRDPTGQLTAEYGRAKKPGTPQAIGIWEGGRRTLKILVDAKEQVTVELDGTPLTTFPLRGLRGGGKLACYIVGRAEMGEAWELEVHEAAIYVKKPGVK